MDKSTEFPRSHEWAAVNARCGFGHNPDFTPGEGEPWIGKRGTCWRCGVTVEFVGYGDGLGDRLWSVR